MSAFNKGPKKVCDFRDNEVVLMPEEEVVILEVKVCVKDKSKDVKLDWSVDEVLMSSEDSADTDRANPNATVEYKLCRNFEQIASTITSKNEILLDFEDSVPSFDLSFTQQSQPNFTFCDTPLLGMNCYQVKAKLLNPAPSVDTSEASVFDRSLVAVCFDEK